MCTYWLHPLINSGSIKLVDMVRKFRPDVKIPDSPIYWQVYRRVKRLAAMGYVKLEKRSRVDWDKTNEQRMDAIESSVQDIFAQAIRKDTPPIISHGTLPTKPDSDISTVTISENALYVVPLGKYITLISRMQNSNRFLDSAKCRTEWGVLKEHIGITLAQLKLQRRRHCPYYVSSRTRSLRIDAVFKLRTVRRHGHFKRRDKRVVNPELQTELDYVQGNFDKYADDVRDLKCALIHKESGEVKLIDYQTRFTDETRKDGIIARFYRTWEKASEIYNTAILLTLTSYPPSEAPKHQHRSSLWHVNRHFSVAWNAYLSLLQKRWKADKRDQLLDAKRYDVKKLRPVTMDKFNQVRLTRSERAAALAPLKLEYQIEKKLTEIQLTEPTRAELTKDELEACKLKVNFRPKYLQVYEFQKNGMIHGHCVIFGRQWLDKFAQVKQDWIRLGQGERCHLYAMHNDGTGWQWNDAKPSDSRNRQPVDYLMKYLGKGVRLSMNHGMYWAINKRFFTNSQALVHNNDLPVEFEKLPAQYEFIGTKKSGDIPAWLEQRDRATRWRAGSGLFDALGWGVGDPGGALA